MNYRQLTNNFKRNISWTLFKEDWQNTKHDKDTAPYFVIRIEAFTYLLIFMSVLILFALCTHEEIRKMAQLAKPNLFWQLIWFMQFIVAVSWLSKENLSIEERIYGRVFGMNFILILLNILLERVY